MLMLLESKSTTIYLFLFATVLRTHFAYGQEEIFSPRDLQNDNGNNNGQNNIKKPPVKMYKKEKPIPGQYIIAFDGLVAATEVASKMKSKINVKNGEEMLDVYTLLFRGAAVKGIGAGSLKKFLEDPDVSSIEEDEYVSLVDNQSPVPGWGVDRIDQLSLPLDNQYNYTYNGTTVDVYVLDSGIRLAHIEFGGRATCAKDFVNANAGCNDVLGHGTHVAGIIGGNTYGVAKGVKLKAVKVISDSGIGRLSRIFSGIEFVASEKNNTPSTPAVINMSLVASRNSTFNQLINTTVQNFNISVVVAAGNNNMDACGFSPASAELAFTVGSTDRYDAKSSFSNFGGCVSIWAPGGEILSADSACDSCTKTRSGTSMASPHAAGVAALVMDRSPNMTITEVYSQIRNSASNYYLPPYTFLYKEVSL